MSKQLNCVPPALGAALRWFAPWVAVLLFGLMALAALVLLPGDKPGWKTVVFGLLSGIAFLTCVIAAYCAYAVIAGYCRSASYVNRFWHETAPLVRAALLNGRAAVWRITATGVVVIDECDDEQSAFIFDLLIFAKRSDIDEFTGTSRCA